MPKVIENGDKMGRKSVKIDLGTASKNGMFFFVFGWILESKWLSKRSPGPPQIDTKRCTKAVWALGPPPDLDFDGFWIVFGSFLDIFLFFFS